MSDENQKKGFTLIEVLVVVAIAVLIGTSGASIGFQAISARICESKAKTLYQALLHGRNSAMAGVGLEDVGVHVENGRIIIFSGQVYAEDDPENAIYEEDDGVVEFTSKGDIIFKRLLGAATEASLWISGKKIHCDRAITVSQSGEII